MKLKHGLFLGFLIGLGSALLYAPKSGKELREELKDKIEIVPKNFLSFLESLVDLAVSVLDFAKVAIEEQSEKITKAVSVGINAAKEKTTELKSYAVKSVSVSK